LSTICENFKLIAHKLRPARISLFSKNVFCFMDRLGLNYNAINPKFAQIKGTVA